MDSTPGAPLRSQFQWSMSANGKTASFADQFTLTGIGNVPDIQPPAGAKPAPGVGGTP
ncbi:MAG: hypothetical protein M0Z27_06160 [Thermaerobacter sp.]|nr:hypothetical protein [Thermaerobacter sp.]